MRFLTIDEVVNYYRSTYPDNPDYRLITPGVSAEELDAFEQQYQEYQIKLPDDVRRLMQTVNFDHFMGFKNLWVYSVHRMRPFEYIPHGYLPVADSEGFVMLLEIADGMVYAKEYGIKRYTLIANTLEEFICTLATVSEFKDYPRHTTRQAAEAAIYPYLDECGIVIGRDFWCIVTRGAA